MDEVEPPLHPRKPSPHPVILPLDGEGVSQRLTDEVDALVLRIRLPLLQGELSAQLTEGISS